MDVSKKGEDSKRQVSRAADCDDVFLKFSISVNYDITEVQSMFESKLVEMLPKAPKNSLFSQLKVADKLTYVILGKPISEPQMVLCANIGACRRCKKLFSYFNREDILNFHKAHKCQIQSNACEAVEKINTNISSFPVASSCSTNVYKPSRNASGNLSCVEDVHNVDVSIRINMGESHRNMHENITSLPVVNNNDVNMGIGMGETRRNILENVTNLPVANNNSFNISSANTFEPPISISEIVSDLQDINKSGLDVYNSINTCNSLRNLDVNMSVMQEVNQRDLSICGISQEDRTVVSIQNDDENAAVIAEEYLNSVTGTEMDIQNVEEDAAAIAEEYLNSVSGTEMDILNGEENDGAAAVADVVLDDEKLDLDTTMNIIDDSIQEITGSLVTEHSGEESETENSDNNSVIIEDNLATTENQMVLIDLCNKLDNPYESSVVADLYNYNLIVTMNEFYKMGRFTDATVVCENQKIECHRLVLSMYSAHFEEMFRECCTNHSAVAIEGLEFWQIKALIDYMYTTRISVDDSKWCMIMEAVDKLQFRDYLRPKKLPQPQNSAADKRMCM